MTKETIVGRLLQAGNISAEEAIILLQTKIVTVRPPAEKSDAEKEADKKRLLEEFEKKIGRQRDIQPWQPKPNPYNPFDKPSATLYCTGNSWGVL